MEIDMGGFENEEIKVHFGGKTYKIMADPPVEAYRMFVKIQSLKLDKEKNWDKVKNFVATIISISNNIDKDKFKKSFILYMFFVMSSIFFSIQIINFEKKF